MAADPFVVHVARLRRSPGAAVHEVRRGEVAQAGPIDEAGIDPGRSVVPAGAEIEVDVTLMPFEGGIDVTGTVTAPWSGICRRCAEPVTGELRIPVAQRPYHQQTQLGLLRRNLAGHGELGGGRGQLRVARVAQSQVKAPQLR